VVGSGVKNIHFRLIESLRYAFVFPAHSASGKLLEIGLSGRTYARFTRQSGRDKKSFKKCNNYSLGRKEVH
jgi:hypothetical protein